MPLLSWRPPKTQLRVLAVTGHLTSARTAHMHLPVGQLTCDASANAECGLVQDSISKSSCSTVPIANEHRHLIETTSQDAAELCLWCASEVMRSDRTFVCRRRRHYFVIDFRLSTWQPVMTSSTDRPSCEFFDCIVDAIRQTQTIYEQRYKNTEQHSINIQPSIQNVRVRISFCIQAVLLPSCQ
jgi:hypothetical protein